MEKNEEYKVKLEVFEGPLDLLLYLIKKDELDISNIPMESVTRQYIEYLEMMKRLDLNVAGEFLVMAATLMMIKSRMLLPAEARPESMRFSAFCLVVSVTQEASSALGGTGSIRGSPHPARRSGRASAEAEAKRILIFLFTLPLLFPFLFLQPPEIGAEVLALGVQLHGF